MIVEEELEWLDDRWVRVNEFLLHPHVDSFAEFAQAYRGAGGLIMAAPELSGRILDQDGGLPFRMFDLDSVRGGAGRSGGLGSALTCGLLWENPDWITLAPGTVLPPPGQIITFRPVEAAGHDTSSASRRKVGSRRPGRAGGVIEGPFTPWQYLERGGDAPGCARSPGKRRL